jgi:hypothetical protein
MEFIYYSANYIAPRTDIDVRKFSAYYAVYGPGVAPVDRTNTIKFPVKTHNLFPIPKINGQGFKLSYEEICSRRAHEILERAEKLDVPVWVLWSGGVDSTTALVSLLKAGEKLSRERIVVMLSEDSITEYPEFYRKHLRGKLKCQSSALLPHMLGRKALFVSGEGNDQLMGSDVIAGAIGQFGVDKIKGRYDRKLFEDFLTAKMGGDNETAKLFTKLFDRLRGASPIEIKTNFDQLWWINFSTKWQTVYTRGLCYTAKANASKMSKKWCETYYVPFFMNDDFQLWSMHNTDQRIRDGWASYKWPSKELIYEFTKDPVYRDNKLKRGSLYFLVLQHRQRNFIDSTYTFHDEVEPAEFYREDHDFK